MFSRDFQLEVAVLEILLDLMLIKNVLKRGLAERFHGRNTNAISQLLMNATQLRTTVWFSFHGCIFSIRHCISFVLKFGFVRWRVELTNKHVGKKKRYCFHCFFFL